MTNKKKILILGIVFWSAVGFAQESKLSLSINNPISIGSPNFRDTYGPIVDLGLKYRYRKYSKFSVGFILNLEFYESRRTIDQLGNSQFSILKPGFITEIAPKVHPGIRLYSAISYASLTASFSNGNDSSGHGLSGIIGINYKMYGSLYFLLQYDYTKLIKSNRFINSLGSDLNIIKVGVECIF